MWEAPSGALAGGPAGAPGLPGRHLLRQAETMGDPRFRAVPIERSWGVEKKRRARLAPNAYPPSTQGQNDHDYAHNLEEAGPRDSRLQFNDRGQHGQEERSWSWDCPESAPGSPGTAAPGASRTTSAEEASIGLRWKPSKGDTPGTAGRLHTGVFHKPGRPCKRVWASMARPGRRRHVKPDQVTGQESPR